MNSPAAAKPKMILLVDDDAAIRDLLASILKNEKYEIVKAGSGREALLALEMNPNSISLILSDIMMEHMDGYEFIKVVKANPQWKTIPFIFLSAKVDAQSRIMGLRLGADDYINKPFNKDEVLAKIKSTVEKVANITMKLTMTGLSGSMQDNELKDLFRVLAMTKKTGMLVIVGKKTAGALYFKNGILINAEKEDRFGDTWGGIWGETSAKELIGMNEGSFRFEPRKVDDIPVAITKTAEELLMEANPLPAVEQLSQNAEPSGLGILKPIDDTLDNHEKGMIQLVALNPNITAQEVEKLLGPTSMTTLSSLISKGYISGGRKQSAPVIPLDTLVAKIKQYRKPRNIYSAHIGLVGSRENVDKFLNILSTDVYSKPDRMPFERGTSIASNPNFSLYKIMIKDQSVQFHTFHYKPNQEFHYNAIFRATSGLIILQDDQIKPDLDKFSTYVKQQTGMKEVVFDAMDPLNPLDFNQIIAMIDKVI